MHHVVLDSGGIIKGESNTYHKLGAKFWTISEVLAEIRDMKAREKLEMLPVDLEVRTPSERAMHAVSSFAKQTGDFAALSLVDLKVMALSYDLELQMNGQQFLRESPKRVSHAIPPKKPSAQQSAKTLTSPAIITDSELEKCVPCECGDEQGQHTHRPVEELCNDLTSSMMVSSTGTVAEGIASHNDDVSDEQEAAIETNKIQEQEQEQEKEQEQGQEQEGDDCEEDDEDDEDELEDEDEEATASRVTFELEPPQQQQTAPCHTSEEDFPSLGGPAPRPPTSSDAPPLPPLPAASSWTRKISSEVLQPATSAQAFAPPRPATHHVISSNTPMTTSGPDTDTTSHFERGGDLSSSAPTVAVNTTVTATSSAAGSGGESKAVPSRILSGGVGGGYVNSEWNTRQSHEDDGVGWINPSNVDTCKSSGQNMLNAQAFENFGSDFKVVSSGKKKHRKKQQSEEPVVARPFNVACMTTDYAMQNVMVQMGLQVLSTSCRLIQQVKQWVLRCGACFQVHYDMDRLFCSRCGSNLMQRISASTDSRTGELRLHLKKNYHYNTRGLVHSLPKAGKQKKYDGELLLREDQLMSGIWRQKVVKIRKDVRSAFGEDVTSDVGMHINKGAAIKVGLGRRNPNADKGRERRGKKKKK